MRGRKYGITREQKNHIDRLFAENGNTLLREQLLVDARREESPLHDLIPWDDREASHLYRLVVAGRILRSYSVMRVKYSVTQDTISQVMGPISIKVAHTEDGPKVHTLTRVVLERADLEARAMADMIARTRTWHKQLLVFPKLVDLHNQLEAVIAAYKIGVESEAV